jgi:hypothetical protein
MTTVNRAFIRPVKTGLVLLSVAALAVSGTAAQASPDAARSAGLTRLTPGALVKPAAVFGADERREVPERYSALEGRIGMLYEPVTQTLCTGFCVAPGVVATAAHCLFQAKKGRLPDLGALSFRIDYGKISLSTGIAGARTGVASHYVAAGTTRFRQAPPLSAPEDWALARLERPVCRFGFLDVEPHTPSELIRAAKDGRIFQVAYHWDWRHWQLAYGGPCVISRNFNRIRWRFIKQHFANPQDLILHDCDTGGASSGSPLLMDTPRGVVAIGVNVGTYTRARILLRYGRVVKRLKPDVIANTGVVGSAFADVIPSLDRAQIIEPREDIMRMQQALHDRGMLSSAVDGEYGKATRKAIRRFEKVNNMPVTGLPTAALLNRLMEERVTPSHLNSSARAPRRRAAGARRRWTPPASEFRPLPWAGSEW